MKPAFVKYQNLGKNLKNSDFTIYSDNGIASPSGLSSDQLLAGSIVQIPDGASKVFVTPNTYDFITSGLNLSFLGSPNSSDGILYITNKPMSIVRYHRTGMPVATCVIESQSTSRVNIANGTNTTRQQIVDYLNTTDFMTASILPGFDGNTVLNFTYGGGDTSNIITDEKFSKLKFFPSGVLNSFTRYSDKDQKYIIWRNTGLSPSMVVSGAGTVSANGIYLENGTYNGFPRYTKSGGTFPADSIYKTSIHNWQIVGVSPNGIVSQLYYYQDSSRVIKSPHLVPNWIANSTLNFPPFGASPAPNVTATQSNGRWVLTSVDSINNTSGASFIKSNTEISVTGVYLGAGPLLPSPDPVPGNPLRGELPPRLQGSGYSGTITINNVDNKLHVFNTPGVTGFVGAYTSGVFTIGGIQRVGFRNDQNPNFYIYKNNLPSAWRAVEDLYNGPFTYYSITGRQGVEQDPGAYPPIVGWELGEKFIINFPPEEEEENEFGGIQPPPPVVAPVVSKDWLPLPEMNFGDCAGNTLIYPNYVYQMDSSDSSIDNIKFYSGGMLSSSGKSELFSASLNDMFPELYDVYFDKNFFYTNEVQGNRFLLFRAFGDTNLPPIYYITRTQQNYNSGYFYWIGGIDYNFNTGINSLQQARKVYTPVGNNINGLKNISINMNPLYLNKQFGEETDLQLATLNSGENIYIDVQPNISGFEDTSNIYKYTVVNSIPQTLDTLFSKNISTPFTGINNANLFNINPTGNIVDVITNKPIVIRVSGNWRNTYAEWLSSPDQINWENFLLTGSGGNRIYSPSTSSGILTYTGFAPYQYLKIQNITGANPTGIIRTSIAYSTPDPSQNTGQFHCLSGKNYIFASPRFNVNKAKCWDTGVNIWSVLDPEYNYLGIQNCGTNSGILPSKFWYTGAWSQFVGNRYSNLRFTKLYPHNINAFIYGNLLYENTGYNYSKISGLFNLNTGQSFVFDLEDNQKVTGTMASKIDLYDYYGDINNNNQNGYWAFSSGSISKVSIVYSSKKLTYRIYRSGVNTSIKKYFNLVMQKCFNK